MTKRMPVLCLVILLVAVGLLPGQPAGRVPGAIRIEVTIVLVPTMVFDPDSRPVTNLEAKDFVINEDGVPQDPFLFSLESHKGEPKEGDGQTSPPEPKRKSDPAFENSRDRKFLLVMDRGRQRRFNTIPQLVHFLRTERHFADRHGKQDQMSDLTREGWYLLGYIPQNKTLDGGFRRIEVQVRRDGLRVEYRRGYYAEGAMKPKSARLLTQMHPGSHGLERFWILTSTMTKGRRR